MEHYLQPIMEYLRLHPTLGLLFTFLVALIESLPVLGTLVPGSVTMTAIGALVGAGVLPVTLTFIASILGAFFGDCLGFWLGSTYHAQIRSIWPFNKITKWLNYSEKFFDKHGVKSVIIGRFIGPTRASMPLIAGMLRLTWTKFLVAGSIAAILWSLIYMIPGILLGAVALEFPHEQLTKVFLLGIATIVCLWLIFWLVQYFFRNLRRYVNHSISSWWSVLRQHKPTHLFVKILSNRQNAYDFHQLTLLLVIFFLGLLFLVVWISVMSHGPLTSVNTPLFYLIQSFSNFGATFWVILTLLGNPLGILATAFIVSIGLFLNNQKRASVHLLLLAIVAAVFTEGVKHVYYSPRPIGFVVNDPSSSFPSGHTLMSTAVFGFLAFLFCRLVSKHSRRLIYFVATLLIFLIGLSRLFLGQHWLTDVLGGWLIGGVFLLLTILSYQRLPKPSSLLTITKTRWLLLLIIGIIIPWTISCLTSFQKTLQDTRVEWPKVTLELERWWENPVNQTPLYRLDRFGKVARPFNIQWAGNLGSIKEFLIAQGWESLELPSHVQSALQRFTSYDPTRNRPILAELYHLRPPNLIFIKHLNHSPDILELQLWNSGRKFKDADFPLWIGTMVYHTPPEKLLRFPRRYMRLQSGQVLLDSTGFQAFEIKSIYIPQNEQPSRIQAMNWDGSVFILKPK